MAAKEMDRGTVQFGLVAAGAEFIRSSGNVFADLGLENAEEELAKALLASAIRQTLRERRLSQSDAAGILRTDQARVFDLMNGKIASMSYERLFRYLGALNYRVRLTIEPVDLEPVDERERVPVP